MAITELGADSARGNPRNAFIHAKARYEMAVADMQAARPDFGTDCVLDLYCEAMFKASDALLETPAPDVAALAYKLEVFRKAEGDGMSVYFHDHLDALIADARRLAGRARP